MGSLEVANTLSASVAPVFLIAGASGLMAIMAHRYGRVIDRIRVLLREGPSLYDQTISFDYISSELNSLYRRAKLLRRTLVLTVLSVFFVSATIFTLFFDFTFNLNIPRTPAVTFSLGLVALMTALILFTQDFLISLRSIKHDIQTRSQVKIKEVEEDGD